MVVRLAARHAHALVVEVPGWWRTRAAVERAVLGRGWNLAFAPADADVLIVCGEPGPRLGEAVEQVWQQMPGPRVRVDVHEYDDVDARLDEAHRGLLDTDHHRHDARQRPAASDLLGEDDGEGGGGGHEGMDHGGGHEGMDMAPSGIPLAEGGEDRDGLEMDVLHVRLGPVLPLWPAGLVLRCALQGDVVTEAQAELPEGEAPPDDDGGPLARRLDNIASLLALAEWDDAVAEARSLRDVALQPGGEPTVGRVERLRRKVRRSRTLRWSLRGIRPLSAEEVHHLGLPAAAAGDTYDRLIGMLDRASAGDGPTAPGDVAAHMHGADRSLSPDSLARLVTGLNLATARLVVASLDLDGLRAGHTKPGMSHG
jgi:hypothetical protein